MKLAIVGAGWAGMAAAVAAADAGADVTVFEATQVLGGRARALETTRPDGLPVTLDNGQHILIGAYSQTLKLMQKVGVDPARALLCLPLALPYPDGSGLQTPGWAARWPAPLDAVAAIATARGWSWAERLPLIRAAMNWQRTGFTCASSLTVAALCARLPQRVMGELIEPLCVSALNLPAREASAQVFLRVMRDALFGPGYGAWTASSLLLPRSDLSSLFPRTAAAWLERRHERSTRVRIRARVLNLQRQARGWRLQGHSEGASFDEPFDGVVWATAAGTAAQAMARVAADLQRDEPHLARQLAIWAGTAAALDFSAITTVYAWAAGARLPAPMLALRADPDAVAAPAQFVFDRGRISPTDDSLQGVLAFVISASSGDREDLQARVLRQAAHQLHLHALEPIQTVVDKRATFACTPGLVRPPATIGPQLWAAGDHVDGPYPATIEGAVRSGLHAVSLIQNRLHGPAAA